MNKDLTYLIDRVENSISAKKELLSDHVTINNIINLADECTRALMNNKKIIIAGNGGSAADAQHISAEFVGRFELERSPLPAIALTVDTSILTAVGNDYGYDDIFVRQLKALGHEGDVFIGISTSGYSENISKAVECCGDIGIINAVFVGNNTTKMTSISDYLIRVRSDITAHIQEVHITIGHILCGLVENKMKDIGCFDATKMS